MLSKSLLSSLGLLLLSSFSQIQAAGVTGQAYGYAKGTTGGGNATPVYPTTTAQLTSYLTDSSPRVIMLDRTFDYGAAEGTCNSCAGCKPSSYTCGSSGQLAIASGTWCNSYPSQSITYEKAGISSITVKSNKSLVGVGSKGVIKGKGLRFVSGVSNIIVQNVHITDLNPEYIWGGDALTLDGSSKIWIDRVTTSLIGRQHIVFGYGQNQQVTISNHHFSGKTSNSASCDGRHYWTLLMYGSNDYITIFASWFDQVSGRSPKIGYTNRVHMLNNLWTNTGSYSFALDVEDSSHLLLEGNVFDNVPRPYVKASSPGKIFAPTSASSSCSSVFGRNCVANTFTGGSPSFSVGDSIISDFNNADSPNPLSNVASSVKSWAGFGKI